jgi:hypothetical protein
MDSARIPIHIAGIKDIRKWANAISLSLSVRGDSDSGRSKGGSTDWARSSSMPALESAGDIAVRWVILQII